jgi:hypothetical protein
MFSLCAEEILVALDTAFEGVSVLVEVASAAEILLLLYPDLLTYDSRGETRFSWEGVPTLPWGKHRFSKIIPM